MSHRKYVEEIRTEEERLPGWLWFFLILPLALVVALLYRYRRDLNSSQPARYSEPDSIPLEMDATRASGSTASAFSGIAPAAEESAPPPAQTADDLKIVEGIGPSISGILNDRGINTYRQLADTPVEQLVEILIEVRLNRIADPTTWPEQARLAAEGRWDDLKAYQDTLSAGKEK